MIKHVGRHGNRRCVILFRQVPGEDHMCLVFYPDMLPQNVHDDVMKALESESGQQSKQFSDYLFRVTLVDGTNALTKLHSEGWIKKVAANQVIVTPNAKSNVRLDELNNILNTMEQGDEAIKKLAELDKGAGFRDPKSQSRDLGEVRAPQGSSQPAVVENNISISDVLTDEQLASQRLAQAQKMTIEAKQLLAEAARLQKEAEELQGATQENVTTKTKKTKADKVKS
jgi:hypothetical protein